MSLSVSSIHVHRSRSHPPYEAASHARATFVSSGPLVIHFDGKLLSAIVWGPRKENRVAIIVTGHEMEKLIAIPKVEKGTGEEVAKAASAPLLEWDISDKVVAMSFDTTAANTGRKKGACALLQQKLGKDFLWLACHHHFHEVLCDDMFKALFGKSSGQNVELFRRKRQLTRRPRR